MSVLFVVLVGVGWLAGGYCEVDTGPYIAFGVGLILIAPKAVACLNKMLSVIEDSDAYIDVFLENAMGVPPKGLNKEYIQKN